MGEYRDRETEALARIVELENERDEARQRVERLATQASVQGQRADAYRRALEMAHRYIHGRTGKFDPEWYREVRNIINAALATDLQAAESRSGRGGVSVGERGSRQVMAIYLVTEPAWDAPSDLLAACTSRQVAERLKEALERKVATKRGRLRGRGPFEIVGPVAVLTEDEIAFELEGEVVRLDYWRPPGS